MKRVLAALLAAVLLLSMSGVQTVFAIEGAGASQTAYRAYGCDVSVWNGGSSTMNFAKMKADGCDFAILRVGFGRTGFTEDTYFYDYYTAARKAGMDLGLYFYSYATTYAEAQGNAQKVIDLIESYGMYFEYPLYIDLEEADQRALSAEAKNQLVLGWCETMEAAGYYPGVYSNASIFDDLYDSTKASYDLWYAYVRRNGPGTQYSNSTHDFSATYSMWQYQWYGTDGGVPVYDGANSTDSNGYYMLDCNIAYKDYPSIMARYGYNNVSSNGGSTAEKLGTYRVTVSSSLNVRSEPDTSADNVVGSLAGDDLVVVTELSDGWGKVTLDDGTVGWCAIGTYGEYIGIDALDTALTPVWGAAALTCTTNPDGSVTFENSAAEAIAVDMPIGRSVGTLTTPWLTMSTTVQQGGYFFGLTDTGSGYFMMRDPSQEPLLVTNPTSTYLTAGETVTIDLREYWQPEQDYHIDTVRLYLAAGTVMTVEYAYFAASSGVVTSTAYNMRPYIASSDPLSGDVNLDGEVSTADVRLLLLFAAGDGALSDMQLTAADVDGDGAATTSDARDILLMVV